ncbi:acyl-CoA dehydrogenase family protein, partial [Rhodococcus sp. CX]|uniref:acyl-CoA dehydrogenase family protein n=2 Tax=unclassified Rhodococcus (in: high G+C Gram-positive bacteria) TaxID=192944 RepID=UPI001E4988F3
MNLTLTDEELAFRDELRTFFTTEIPAELRERVAAGRPLGRDDIVTSQRILNAHGLAVPHWPVEWGGKDWTSVQRHLWLDELQLASVPDPLPFNTAM